MSLSHPSSLFPSGPSRCGALVGIVLMVMAVGCTSEEPASDAPADEAAPAELSRIFFMEPADGATVSSPVMMRFGAENFIIEPVGEGAIHEGAGHYHIGYNVDCLMPGEVIVQGNPSWIHFGDGSSEIELQLDPGEYRLCLQIGDGEHRTLAGESMSDVITITVE